MEILLIELRQLALEIEERMFRAGSVNELDTAFLDGIIADKPYYLAVVDMSQVKPVYFCPKGMETLGLKRLGSASGMAFLARFLSPDNLPVVKDGISHFVSTPEEPFIMTYRVKTIAGWRWLYGISIAVNNPTADSFFTLSILRDVEDSFEKLLTNERLEKPNGVLPSLNARRLVQLSQREKEVLLLMAEDITTQQMAEKLHIAADTIQFHRKQLKRKLKVSTSNGLVRYAIHLQTFMDSL